MHNMEAHANSSQHTLHNPPATAMAADDSEYLPRELAVAIEQAKPVCPFYNTGHSRGCRKGAKCPLRHTKLSDLMADGAAGPLQIRLPHVSRVVQDGQVKMCLRPPLFQSLQMFFEAGPTTCPLAGSEIWNIGSEQLVTFQCSIPPEVDSANAAAARVAAGANVVYSGGATKWHGVSTAPGLDADQAFFVHGTTLEASLAILRDGKIRVGPGICGEGVYAFNIPDGSNESIAAGWERCRAGQYNWGALFLLRVDRPTVFKLSKDAVVPSGCVGHLRDQYSLGAQAAVMVSVTWVLDGIVGAVGKELDRLGYTAALHTALRNVQDFLNNAGGQKLRAMSAEASSSTGQWRPKSSIRLLNNIVDNRPTEGRRLIVKLGCVCGSGPPHIVWVLLT
jgi:hypothetical protein